ncbi:MAG: hypothetical protein B7Y01_00815 [Xanthobacter sp. 17-67-6]|nr:MAG: hypothetical protein B7Y12_18130 [Rhizobiales bacterium 24-66-13]OYZ94674.1 MAG: hypothetical protein B7Y01_00815 [Xanthobacter sp. 17-67-6]
MLILVFPFLCFRISLASVSWGMSRPLAEKILVDRRRPARQGHLTAVTGTNPRALDFDLAAVKADLSLGSAPTMSLPIATATMARAAEPSRILFHHTGESGSARPSGTGVRSWRGPRPQLPRRAQTVSPLPMW